MVFIILQDKIFVVEAFNTQWATDLLLPARRSWMAMIFL